MSFRYNRIDYTEAMYDIMNSLAHNVDGQNRHHSLDYSIT